MALSADLKMVLFNVQLGVQLERVSMPKKITFEKSLDLDFYKSEIDMKNMDRDDIYYDFIGLFE